MSRKIIIGSRGSKLALVYAQKVKDNIIKNTNLKDEDILIKKIKTIGDQVKDIRLSEVGGKGLLHFKVAMMMRKLFHFWIKLMIVKHFIERTQKEMF